MDAGIWRDQQLNSFLNLKNQPVILKQEKVMLAFVEQFPDVIWKWQAPKSQFYNLCSKKIRLSDRDYDGLILFGLPLLDTKNLVEQIKVMIQPVKYAYVAINRYMISTHNLELELPDDIGESIDVIMQHLDSRFCRLAKFDEVDGNHLVFSHPMDCYRLCK